jgi:hypothetical protein
VEPKWYVDHCWEGARDELVVPVINSTLNMGMESVPAMLDNLHTLTPLSAYKDFIEFCHHKSFKSFIVIIYLASFLYSV